MDSRGDLYMKVYVIEKGWYSDRHIIGVVETEEEAKRVVEAIKNGDDYYDNHTTYVEYDTHQFKTLLQFKVEYLCGDWYVEFYDLENLYDKSTEIYEDNWIILAKDSKQAVKIAQDMRAERLARNKGIS